MENALNGETSQVQFSFINRDSDKVNVDGYTNYWFENGKPTLAHTLLKNIKTRLQQEEMLQLSATFFEHTNDGIFVTDNYPDLNRRPSGTRSPWTRSVRRHT